jgi:hypothetical protein
MWSYGTVCKWYDTRRLLFLVPTLSRKRIMLVLAKGLGNNIMDERPGRHFWTQVYHSTLQICLCHTRSLAENRLRRRLLEYLARCPLMQSALRVIWFANKLGLVKGWSDDCLSITDKYGSVIPLLVDWVDMPDELVKWASRKVWPGQRSRRNIPES